MAVCLEVLEVSMKMAKYLAEWMRIPKQQQFRQTDISALEHDLGLLSFNFFGPRNFSLQDPTSNHTKARNVSRVWKGLPIFENGFEKYFQS